MWKRKPKAKAHDGEPGDNEAQTSKKTKYMLKRAKHSVRRPKLKDAKVLQKIKKLGKDEDPNTCY